MKKIILTLAMFLFALSVQAQSVGYIDYTVIYKEYAPAKQLQTKIDAKVQEIRTYNKTTSSKIKAQKTNEAKAKVASSRKPALQKLEQEYIDLRYKQEGLVREKVKVAANVVLKQKNLDAIIDKKSIVAGGVDCTRDILKAIK